MIAFLPFALLFAAIRMILVPSDRKRCDWVLAASALSLLATFVSLGTVYFLSKLRPYKVDEYIFKIDGLLGFQPSFAIGRLLVNWNWLKLASITAYNLLPCTVVGIFSIYLWQKSQDEALVMGRTFILNLFLAVPFYLLFPASGPVYAFLGFPFMQPGHFVPHAILLSAPPNCIPSVHTSTALLILWFSRQWRLGSMVSTVYLALIVTATLGTGEHYFFDLIVAIPYSAFVLWIDQLVWKPQEQQKNQPPHGFVRE